MPVIQPKKEVGSALAGHEFESAVYAHPSLESDACPQPEKVVMVLAISPFEEDHIFLRNIFGHSKWHIRGVRCWGDASPYLAAHRTPVVICESELPDANWKEVLEEVERLPDTPVLIVTSRLADDYLWAEVLNLGGYDVLMKPFDPVEVVRVISLAWLNWKQSSERARKVLAPKLSAAGV